MFFTFFKLQKMVTNRTKQHNTKKEISDYFFNCSYRNTIFFAKLLLNRCSLFWRIFLAKWLIKKDCHISSTQSNRIYMLVLFILIVVGTTTTLCWKKLFYSIKLSVTFFSSYWTLPASIYLFKASNRSTGKRCETCSTERRYSLTPLKLISGLSKSHWSHGENNGATCKFHLHTMSGYPAIWVYDQREAWQRVTNGSNDTI